MDYRESQKLFIKKAADDFGVYGRYIGCPGSYDSKTQMTSSKSRTELKLPNGEEYTFKKKSKKHIPALQNIHDWLKKVDF